MSVLVKSPLRNSLDIKHNMYTVHLIRFLYALKVVSIEGGYSVLSAIDDSRPAGSVVDWDKHTMKTLEQYRQELVGV